MANSNNLLINHNEELSVWNTTLYEKRFEIIYSTLQNDNSNILLLSVIARQFSQSCMTINFNYLSLKSVNSFIPLPNLSWTCDYVQLNYVRTLFYIHLIIVPLVQCFPNFLTSRTIKHGKKIWRTTKSLNNYSADHKLDDF
jgi:hypothetical protein